MLYGFIIEEVWTQRRIPTDQIQAFTRQNKSRSIHFKAAIFLLRYLLSGHLQLTLQPCLVLPKVLELLLSFISQLTGIQAEAGLWESRVQTALWFG